MAGARPIRPPASTSASRRSRAAPPAGHVRQPDRASSCTRRPKAPDAAWEFVKYLVSARGPGAADAAEGRVAGHKEVLAGPYATVVRRAPRSSPTASRTRTSKPSFAGLRGVRRRSSRESWTRTCSTPPTRRRRRRSTSVAPAARRPARRPVATAGDPLPRTRAAHRERGPAPPAAGSAGPRRAPGCRHVVGRAVPRPDGPGPGPAVGRAHRRDARHQPDRLGPAHPARAGGPRQLHGPADR